MAAHTFDTGSSDRGWTDAIFRGFSPPSQELANDPRNPGINYFNDFRAGVPANEWTTTVIGTTPTAVTDPTVAEIGGLLMTTTTSAGDGLNIQHLGCVFTPAAGKVVAVEFRLKLGNLANADCFFGLAATDTTIIASGATTSGDTIGFSTYTDDGVLLFASGNSATPTASSTSPGTLAADTYAKIGLRLEGISLTGQSSLEVYFNGAKVANSVAAATIPDAALRLSMALQSGTTAAETATVDWVRMCCK